MPTTWKRSCSRQAEGKWKRQAVEGLAEVFSKGAERRNRDRESEVRDLLAKIGGLIVERDLLLRGPGR